MTKSIETPVAQPFLHGNERIYVDDCLSTGWISSAGAYVERFENAFADYCGVRHAIACCNGTAALHLALLALGVQAGDDVIVPTLTFVATPNAVSYCNARPVFVDSEPLTWNLNPAAVEAAITPRTRGIIAVHLYGCPAEMDLLREIADAHDLFLLEDAAEAHGATYHGRTVGALGDAATFSFYANKIITTGEGGMVVTDDDAIAKQARLLCGQGMDPNTRYWHTLIGYNYRMTNLCAAIGLAQLEQIDMRLEERAHILSRYRSNLGEKAGVTLQREPVGTTHVNWMFSLSLDRSSWPERDDIAAALKEKGIETRPVFYPCHSLPPYAAESEGMKFPIADDIARHGITLPTWSGLSDDHIDFVCDELSRCSAEPREQKTTTVLAPLAASQDA